MAGNNVPDTDTQTINAADVVNDSDFQGLPLGEKHKVLLHDPDYAGLPAQEQMKALDQIHYGSQPGVVAASTQPENFLSRTTGAYTPGELWNNIKSATSSAIQNPGATIKEGAKNLARTVGINPDADYSWQRTKQSLEHPLDAVAEGWRGSTGIPRMIMHPVESYENLTRAPQLAEDISKGNVPAATGDLVRGAANVAPLFAGKPSTGMIGEEATGAPALAEGAAKIPDAIRARLGVGDNLKSARDLHLQATMPQNAQATDLARAEDNFSRAAPYLKDEFANRPVTAGRGGAMRTAERVGDAADRQWNSFVQPVIENNGDLMGSGSNVANAIRTVNPDSSLAEHFDGPMTVRELNGELANLNANNQLRRYMRLPDAEKAQTLTNNPKLEEMSVAADALRQELGDAIERGSGEQDANAFRSARRDWGALHSMELQYGRARVATPVRIGTRFANSIRGFVGAGRSPEFYVRGGADTLFGRSNPDHMIPEAMNKLGNAEDVNSMPDVVEHRPGPPEFGGTVNPGVPPTRQLPPIGETGQGGANPATGYPAPGGPSTNRRVIEAPGVIPAPLAQSAARGSGLASEHAPPTAIMRAAGAVPTTINGPSTTITNPVPGGVRTGPPGGVYSRHGWDAERGLTEIPGGGAENNPIVNPGSSSIIPSPIQQAISGQGTRENPIPISPNPAHPKTVTKPANLPYEEVSGYHYGAQSVGPSRQGGKEIVLVHENGGIANEARAAGQKTYQVRGGFHIADLNDPIWHHAYDAAVQANNGDKVAAANDVERMIRVAGYDGYRKGPGTVALFGDARSAPHPTAAEEKPVTLPPGAAGTSQTPGSQTSAKSAKGSSPKPPAAPKKPAKSAPKP